MTKASQKTAGQPGVDPLRRAQRIGDISVSPIVTMSEAARQRRSEGRPVISLSIGEPDFNPPPHIGEAAIAAIGRNDIKYPPLGGKPALREAIATRYAELGMEQCSIANTLVSSGAKQTLYNAFMATLNPGDEVILPAPYWVSYADIVRICGGVPVTIACQQQHGFRLQPEQLEKAISNRTRWLLINSPSNPSGAVLDSEDLRRLGAVLADHPHVGLMSDEIYEDLAYGRTRADSIASVLPELADRSLIISGVSKSWAMTGWRLGWGVGPQRLIRAMMDIQAQNTSGTCSIAQAAALAALTGPADSLVSNRSSYERRRDIVCAALSAMPGISCSIPDGAFYVFPSWQALIGARTADGRMLQNDMDFCHYLLDTAEIATVPGEAFAMAGHLRLSYACSEAELTEAMQRMTIAVKALEKSAN